MTPPHPFEGPKTGVAFSGGSEQAPSDDGSVQDSLLGLQKRGGGRSEGQARCQEDFSWLYVEVYDRRVGPPAPRTQPESVEEQK